MKRAMQDPSLVLGGAALAMFFSLVAWATGTSALGFTLGFNSACALLVPLLLQKQERASERD